MSGETTAASFIRLPSSSTAACYRLGSARPVPVFVHSPRGGGIPARYRPYFRRCPCCGCDVLDALTGGGAKRGDCCNLCHPRGDCQDCQGSSAVPVAVTAPKEAPE